MSPEHQLKGVKTFKSVEMGSLKALGMRNNQTDSRELFLLVISCRYIAILSFQKVKW